MIGLLFCPQDMEVYECMHPIIYQRGTCGTRHGNWPLSCPHNLLILHLPIGTFSFTDNHNDPKNR